MLIAFGFGYSAAGFLEAGEPIKAHNLRELTDPISKAEEAERLFATFAKADLPARLVKFDKALRQADYISLYKEFNAKGEWMPQTVWNDVAHKAINQGVRGLMDL